MEIKKFVDRKVILPILAIGMGATAVAACSSPNYSGGGNDFVIEGVVTDAGSQSLQAEIEYIESVHGQADGWFEIGEKHRIHDNCDCHGFWAGRKQYGEVRDLNGQVIEPSEVPIGQCVEFFGKIRSDNEGKVWDDRPVYDVAQEISCDTN